MKTERNILIAFILNLAFSMFELVGGIFTGSVAILSDALHDLGDAVSIGVAWALERKSKRPPDETHTYGYGRYSVLGGVLTSVILLVGSIFVICNAVGKFLAPTPISYDGMIIFAIVGVVVNLVAAFVTREGDTINQRAVNLHMLEDVLGWIVVLVGAVIMRFTDIRMLDPILSVVVSVFILVNAVNNLKEAAGIFLEKTPEDVDLYKIKECLEALDGVESVHHIHIRTIDGTQHSATLHAVISADAHKAKDSIRKELKGFGIDHATVETENLGEHCHNMCCNILAGRHHCHHHHH